MKLYHATAIENVEDINEYGLRPSVSEKESSDESLEQEGFYVFSFIKDAIVFITDYGQSSYAVYSFECENPTGDTEYESNSYACINEDYVEATLELIEA